MLQGIKSGDVIQSINDREVKSIMEVSTFINASSSETIDIEVLEMVMNLLYK